MYICTYIHCIYTSIELLWGVGGVGHVSPCSSSAKHIAAWVPGQQIKSDIWRATINVYTCACAYHCPISQQDSSSCPTIPPYTLSQPSFSHSFIRHTYCTHKLFLFFIEANKCSLHWNENYTYIHTCTYVLSLSFIPYYLKTFLLHNCKNFARYYIMFAKPCVCCERLLNNV